MPGGEADASVRVARVWALIARITATAILVNNYAIAIQDGLEMDAIYPIVPDPIVTDVVTAMELLILRFAQTAREDGWAERAICRV